MTRPTYKKKSNGPENPFSDLGVELSKSLPTFDVPVDLIAPSDNNPNDMSDDEFNRLVEELENVDFVEPIQIVPAPGGKFKIIAGEHRWRGAQTLGRDVIPCNILTDERFMDEDLQDLLMVRMNVIKGSINPEKFRAMYEDKAKKYGADQLQALFGYTSTDAWKKVTKGLTDAVKSSGMAGSGAIAAELQKRAGRIRSVDGLGSILKGLMKQYGEDLKHGFMFFVFGGKRHLHVIMSDRLKAAVESLARRCRSKDLQMGDVLAEALEAMDVRGGEKEQK